MSNSWKDSFFVVADFHNIQLDKRVKTAIAEIYRLSVFLCAFAALALTFRFYPIAAGSKTSMTRQTIDDECTLFFSVVLQAVAQPPLLRRLSATAQNDNPRQWVSKLRDEEITHNSKIYHCISLIESYDHARESNLDIEQLVIRISFRARIKCQRENVTKINFPFLSEETRRQQFVAKSFK